MSLCVRVVNIWTGTRRRPLVLVLLALLLAARGAEAAGGDRFGRPLAIDSLHGHVALAYDRRSRSQDLRQFGGGFQQIEDNEAIFEEELAVATRGYAYHPRLLIFDIDAVVTFQQRNQEIAGQEGIDSDTVLQDYRADLTLLQQHPYTLQLFASRATFDVDSVFVARQKVTNETEGLRLSLKALPFPTILSFQHTENDQEGRFRRQEERVEARYQSRFRTPDSDGYLTYDFDDRQSTYFDEPLITHRLRFAGSSRLGAEHQGRAKISAGLERQSGAFIQQKEDASGDLRWRFTDHLQSDTRLRVDRQDRQERDFLLVTGETRLAHQLYESLTTTLSVDGARQTLDDAGVDEEVGGGLGFDYRKRIPGGTLILNLNGHRSFNREEDLGGLGQVVDEAHTIPAEGFVFLDEPSADVESLIVTDNSGLTLFVEGIDYRLDKLGSTVRLTAITTGALQLGTAILVDYAFRGQPDATFYTDTWGGGGRLAFDWGLSLFAQHGRTSHDLQSGSDSGDRLQTTAVSTAGIELDRGPSRTSLSYQEQDNRTNPFRRWQADESLRFRPTANLSLILNAGWGVTVLPKEDESLQGITAVGRVEWQPVPVARLQLTTLYASQERVDDRIDRLRVEVEARFRHRAIEAILSDSQEFSDSDLSGERRENLLYVNVRRLY